MGLVLHDDVLDRLAGRLEGVGHDLRLFGVDLGVLVAMDQQHRAADLAGEAATAVTRSGPCRAPDTAPGAGSTPC